MAPPAFPTEMLAYTYPSTTNGLEKNLTLNRHASLPVTCPSALKPDTILVKVLTAALNPVDYKFPEMPIMGAYLIGTPATPSLDYSGRVVACGPNTGKISSTELKEGQLVFGRLNGPSKVGTLAEYTVVPRSGCAVVPPGEGKAEGISADDAACVGTAGLTAYQCIVPFIEPGGDHTPRVFINGGSGGTGTFGIQIAKALGCFVAVSCSGGNAKLCKSLGADAVIDYKTQDLVTTLAGMEKFDLVVDNVGTPASLFFSAHSFTTPNAKFVQVGAPVGDFPAMVYDLLSKMLWPGFLGGGKRSFAFVGVENKLDEFERIAQWMVQGKVKAVVDETFGIEDKGGVKAFEKLKGGRVRGKVLVKVSDN